MCVICAAARKRHMKREEVLEAIRHNSAGFFGFTVHDGVRRTIRTLDDKEFMEFFDSVGDDEPWIMHARIPSRGEKTLGNVHGWEQDGIIFCHNMTLAALDDMMKHVKWEGTDSEFFFRHVFIPFYRGCGEDAYKDGQFCSDLDNLVRHFCGSFNKFLFIMPDNRIVMYGNWVEEPDRKEDGKCAFYASNSSYKVYVPKWPARKDTEPVSGFSRGRYGWGGYEGYGEYGGCGVDDDDLADYEDDTPLPAARNGPAGSVADRLAAEEEALHAKIVNLVRDTCGDAGLCRLALCDLVAHGTVAYRALPGDWAADGEENDVFDYLTELMPDCFDENSYDVVVRGIEKLADSDDTNPFTPADFAGEYADEIAEGLVKMGAKSQGGVGIVPTFPTKTHVEGGLKLLTRQWRAFARIAGVALDFSAKGAASFACVAENPERDGNRWKTCKVKAEDILVDETESPETTYKAVGALLEFIRGASEGEPLERSLA